MASERKIALGFGQGGATNTIKANGEIDQDLNWSPTLEGKASRRCTKKAVIWLRD